MITDPPMPQLNDILRGYRRLTARVDAWSSDREGLFGDRIACRPGCAGCCQRSLSVSALEAAAIRDGVAEHGLAEPGAGEAFVSPLAVLPEAEGACAMLDPAGRCRIYSARPLICRTHGLPLAVQDEDGGLMGDVCPLSFDEGGGLADLASSDFLDVTTLDVILGALDLQYTRATGLEPGRRTSLSELAEELA